MSTTELLESARQLRADERIALVEAILATLDEPDPSMEAAWTREAEDRIAAWRGGEMPTGDLEAVLARHRPQ